jgi:hypothetical protein
MIRSMILALLLMQEGLSNEEFARLHAMCGLPKNEAWRSLSWNTSVLEARAKALREKKPVYLWAAVGHPLGAGSGHVIIDRTLFRDTRVQERLKAKFVLVAVDQTYQRNQHDPEGDFYRSLVVQGPRNNVKVNTSGHYAFAPDGKLLGFAAEDVSTDDFMALLDRALAEFHFVEAPIQENPRPDRYFHRVFPEGGAAVVVTAKVLGGYGSTDDRGVAAIQEAIGCDYLWIRKDEAEALAKGSLPESLRIRMLQWHLTTPNVGAAGGWGKEEILKGELRLAEGRVTGSFQLEAAPGSKGFTNGRGFEGSFAGLVESKGGKLTRFDLVAKGIAWGKHVNGAWPPRTKYPLAVTFTLADEADLIARRVPPNGMRSPEDGYLGQP